MDPDEKSYINYDDVEQVIAEVEDGISLLIDNLDFDALYGSFHKDDIKGIDDSLIKLYNDFHTFKTKFMAAKDRASLGPEDFVE